MIYLRLLLLLSIFSACAQPLTEKQWLHKNTTELTNRTTYDFSAIKEAIGDKRIVALGESTHGLAQYYKLKAELVIYLQQELGFEVLAMEGGLGDINLAYFDIDTLSATGLRDNTLFGNFRAEEANVLFNHIKATSTSKKALHFAGYDTQYSSNYFLTKLQRLIEPYNQTFSDSLFTNAYSFQESYRAGMAGDSLGYTKHRDRYIHTARHSKQLLLDYKQELLSTHKITAYEMEVMIRTLEMFAKSVDLSFENRTQTYGLRDQLMAENLYWLIDTLYAGKKIIVWAHNAHIEKGKTQMSHTKWMGHFLKEKYQSDYYSIGIFAYEGTAYQHWTQNSIPFKNEGSHMLERKFMETGKQTAFLDMSDLQPQSGNQWLFKTITAYELENGGEVSFQPFSRFDGMISIKKSGIPTYGK